MHEPYFVRGIERATNVADNVDGFVGRETPPLTEKTAQVESIPTQRMAM
jgi:hypothetical protein